MLPSAPPSLLDAEGHPRLGRYLGHVDADWSAAPVGRVRRTLAGKRWLYAGAGTGTCFAAVAIIDLGWAASAFAYLFDRETRRMLADLSWAAPPWASRVSTMAGPGGRATFAWGGDALRIERVGARWEVRVATRTLEMRLELDATAAPPTLCAVARPPGAFANCTHKTVCLPASGEAAAGGRRFLLDGAYAIMDHTSGLLARDTRWRWAAAAGPGVGLNLVEGFNGEVENAVWLGDRVVPVGPARFDFDTADPMRPWQIRSDDGIVELEFQPEGRRAADKNLVIARSRYVQPVGSFRGVLRPPGSAPVDVRDLLGVTEDHVARW